MRYTRGRIALMTAGGTLLALAAVWPLVVTPKLTERIPPGYEWRARYVGTQNFADSTGRFAPVDPVNAYERHVFTGSDSSRPHAVELVDRYSIRTTDRDSLIWEYVTRAQVNPRTGAHLRPEWAGQVALFPRGARRQTYTFRSNYVYGLPLAFSRQEDVLGLATNLYAYNGPAEYTDSYRGSPAYPGVAIPAGQEIRCADDQFYFRVWVEPVSGEFVKTEEGCPSGDYFYVIATGRRLRAVDRWEGATAGPALALAVGRARRERLRITWLTWYAPALLAVAGLALVGAGFRRADSARTP